MDLNWTGTELGKILFQSQKSSLSTLVCYSFCVRTAQIDLKDTRGIGEVVIESISAI